MAAPLAPAWKSMSTSSKIQKQNVVGLGELHGVATITEDLQVPCTGWNVLRHRNTAE